jgi:oligoribonuclease
MTLSSENLIWLDLEMTGLNPNIDYIIEIATVVTDKELKPLAEGPMIAIYQDESVLEGMDEWNTTQHGKSGLLERVRNSKYSVWDAERMTLDFLKEHVPANTSPMCGNSICQDRRFMFRLMPDLEKYFLYRNLDVSTVKELVKRWTTGKDQFIKNASHLALDDVYDSIEEMQHYRAKYFNI